MRLRSVPFSFSLAYVEERALARIRSALDADTATETLRALIHTAHGELCPDLEVDAALQALATARAQVVRELHRGRKPVKREPVLRLCKRPRCGKQFAVPQDNKAQKFCCRGCYDAHRAEYGQN